MLEVIQGTTPNIIFNLTDTEIPTSSLAAVEMTVSDCNGVKITKSTATYSETYLVTFSLTQSETLALSPGDYRIQMRIKTTAGKIKATKLTQMRVFPLASKVSI